MSRTDRQKVAARRPQPTNVKLGLTVAEARAFQQWLKANQARPLKLPEEDPLWSATVMIDDALRRHGWGRR